MDGPRHANWATSRLSVTTAERAAAAAALPAAAAAAAVAAMVAAAAAAVEPESTSHHQSRCRLDALHAPDRLDSTWRKEPLECPRRFERLVRLMERRIETRAAEPRPASPWETVCAPRNVGRNCGEMSRTLSRGH